MYLYLIIYIFYYIFPSVFTFLKVYNCDSFLSTTENFLSDCSDNS